VNVKFTQKLVAPGILHCHCQRVGKGVLMAADWAVVPAFAVIVEGAPPCSSARSSPWSARLPPRYRVRPSRCGIRREQSRRYT